MVDFFEYLLNNHDKLLYSLASISLLAELTIIGLSGVLLFFSIACALTGVMISLNIITSWEMEIFSVGILSLLSAFFLWKPLKNFQNRKILINNSSDMIGKTVPVSITVTRTEGAIRHSGINWTARLASECETESIIAGDQAIITGVDGNIVLVNSIP